ncbi:MAG: FIST C-terminal domain-containing protein [Defluviitaleaceae bacterium]|nr:FIST C-terminal domain-containing protein [Defluviitaleaceae bacterium]
MKGTAIKMVEKLLNAKAKDNPVLQNAIKIKLMMKGIPIQKLDAATPDDTAMIAKIKEISKEYGVSVDYLMNLRSICSVKTTVQEVVADLLYQLAGFETKMIVFFASRVTFEPSEISKQIQDAFPQSVVFGCSSHAENFNGKTQTASVSAMVFNSNVIESAKVEALENLSDGINVQPAFDAFDVHFGTPMSSVDYSEFGGIVLVDGLSLKEEEVMDKIGVKTNIMFTGGSASDSLNFNSTYVYANGKAYTDAALLAVFKTKNGVDFIKTQSVDVTDVTLTVTKADTAKRAIIEFDNKPAVTRYAEALGVSCEGVDAHFFGNPLGLVIGTDVFVRSCQKIDGETLYLYCNVHEDTTLNLLKIKDIVPDTKSVVHDKLKELGSIAGILDFSCVLRTMQLINDGKTEAYANIFNGIPTSGFSTYGEEFLGHINQTSTMLVFK